MVLEVTITVKMSLSADYCSTFQTKTALQFDINKWTCSLTKNERQELKVTFQPDQS